MWHGGLLTALVVATASIPLAMMDGDFWSVSSRFPWRAGSVGKRSPSSALMNSFAYCCEGNLARGHTSNSIDD